MSCTTTQAHSVVLLLSERLTSLLRFTRLDCALRHVHPCHAQEGTFDSLDEAHDSLRRFRHAFGYRKNFALFVDDLVSGGTLTSDAAQRVIAEYNASAFVLGTAPHIQPFPSTVPVLEALKEQGYKLGLLCSGTPESQWEKIHTLGVASYFDHVLVVPAGNLSGDGNLSKVTPVLKNMAKQLAVPTSKLVLVGKRVFAELKAAKQLGLVTVRMVYGKYAKTMPADDLEQPHYQMSSLDQLPAILVLAEGRRPRPHIVALGGGTGLAVLLKALREYPADLTAIVTVFDSGRHSGELRKTLGILPPGDIRNCLVALSDSDQVLHQLMNYRFQDHYLEGASLGNLLLAALTDIHGGKFDQAIASISDILNIRGQVLPATLDQAELCAVLTDGTTVVAEENVRSPNKSAPIDHVFLDNASVTAYPAAVAAIEAADIILISPGGFYTSIITTLLVPGIKDAIARATGAVVYISNVATQHGQSDGYTLPQTLRILAEYLGDDVVDYVIANNARPPTLPFQHGETLLLPTREMEMAERPILVQGRAFNDMSAFDVEWKKVPMIKHNGEMVLSMLYRIIEKEMEGGMTERTKTQYMQLPSRGGRGSASLQPRSPSRRCLDDSDRRGSRRSATFLMSLGFMAVVVATTVAVTKALLRRR
ncbi:hypothetical protein, variant [Aphanomyces invadans]|uniref:Gluconeogenesis factor n=1 Tax=Aphanomyces invadans TaxID=157072 RepID=A0A024U5J7_9STRA|nr:hypothetical protein, variant [Aphanomyces invadans]ETW01534.1 hypothetical protein, variant [Aphanomyces invadans]|eukprot:XP_008869382.1 hypothetical protein, variant [Aphanomyces invadans]